jgi:hypothetical protein
MRERGVTKSVFLAAAACLAGLIAAGCAIERADTTPRWSKSRSDRLALFAGIEKLVIAPFRDPAESPGMDADMFARFVANELLPLKRFKVIYPDQLAARVREANRGMAPDKIIDLSRSETDAVNAARTVKADAVLVATVHDFGVYPPKRLAVTFRVYLAGAPHRSCQDMINLTSAGVPQEVPGHLRDKFIWERQWHYDAGRKRTRLRMSGHAHRQEKDRGFGEEIAYYSTTKFLGFVAADISGKLYKDSQWYKSGAGRALARKHGIDYRNLSGTRSGGSGYTVGSSDHGTGKGRSSRPSPSRSRSNLGASSSGVRR